MLLTNHLSPQKAFDAVSKPLLVVEKYSSRAESARHLNCSRHFFHVISQLEYFFIPG